MKKALLIVVFAVIAMGTIQGATITVTQSRSTDGSAEEASAVFIVKDAGAPPPPPNVTLKLVSPNGNELWGLGTEHTISWTSTNLTGKVQLDLIIYKSATRADKMGVIKDNLPANGSHQWKAGEYSIFNTAYTVAPGQYRIRVSSMTNNDYHDLSDAPFNLSLMINQSKPPSAFKAYASLPGIYQNYPGTATFPSKLASPFPWNIYSEAFKKFPNCGINQFANAGVYWWAQSSNASVAVIYRSRIHFPLSKFAGKSAKLESAKLKMKRVHSIHEDANSGCGCSENIWVLKAPMTAFAYPAIGQRIGVSMGAAEFSKDITDIVKKWLDGTVANNGLLLLAGELPCSGGRTCFSCYEASLLLTMK